jgi:hypothetical protein
VERSHRGRTASLPLQPSAGKPRRKPLRGRQVSRLVDGTCQRYDAQLRKNAVTAEDEQVSSAGLQKGSAVPPMLSVARPPPGAGCEGRGTELTPSAVSDRPGIVSVFPVGPGQRHAFATSSAPVCSIAVGSERTCTLPTRSQSRIGSARAPGGDARSGTLVRAPAPARPPWSTSPRFDVLRPSPSPSPSPNARWRN